MPVTPAATWALSSSWLLTSTAEIRNWLSADPNALKHALNWSSFLIETDDFVILDIDIFDLHRMIAANEITPTCRTAVSLVDFKTGERTLSLTDSVRQDAKYFSTTLRDADDLQSDWLDTLDLYY